MLFGSDVQIMGKIRMDFVVVVAYAICSSGVLWLQISEIKPNSYKSSSLLVRSTESNVLAV